MSMSFTFDEVNAFLKCQWNTFSETVAKNETVRKITKVVTPVWLLFKDICYKNSIFFALDNEALAAEAQKYKDYTRAGKFILGVKTGILQMIPSLLLLDGLDFILMNAPEGVSANPTPGSLRQKLLVTSLVAIVEEIVFRGLLQNSVAGVQRAATYIAPQCIKKSKTFQWLVSPSARILIINSIFGLVHLMNSGGPLSTKDAIIQVTRIILMPTESNLHETTGNIIAPISAHMTNNIVARLLSAMGI